MAWKHDFSNPSIKHLFAIKLVGPTQVYAPVHQCIYCGPFEGQLTTEHVIAESLGGNLLLPKASCASCQKETGRFETEIARHFLWPLRTQMQFPSKKKRRPKTFKIAILMGDDTEVEYEVPLELFPAELYLYKLHPCGLFDGKPESDGDQLRAQEWRWGPSPENIERVLRSRFGGKGIYLSRFHPWPFMRMLAKIAHAYAIAEYGLTNFTPLTLDVILNRSDRIASHFIGGSLEQFQEDNEYLHHIWTEALSIGERHYLVIQMHLFSLFGGAKYHVVVGELSESQLYQVRKVEPFQRKSIRVELTLRK